MELTAADQKIAEYILEHVDTIGLLTSTALAMDIGVSDTSVIRFVRKLGFRGYAEFRGAMSDRLALQCSQNQRDLSPSEKYDSTRALLNRDTLISDVSNYTLDNLQKSLSRLDNDTVQAIVDIILASDRKYVAGFRGTACCAQYMASKLVLVLPHIVPVTHSDGSAIENLTDITEKDCLILYSFPRYSEICGTLMEIAHRHGAKVILVTDRLTSPLAGKADVVVVAHVKGLGFTNSYVAPLSISEVILLAISGRNVEKREARIRELDAAINEKKLY